MKDGSHLDLEKLKNGCLAENANDISCICVPLLQCKPNVVVSSSYSPLFEKIGAPDPSNIRNRCLENLMQQELQANKF